MTLHTPLAGADFTIPTVINNNFSVQYQNIDQTGKENTENHQLWNHYLKLDATIVNYICMYKYMYVVSTLSRIGSSLTACNMYIKYKHLTYIIGGRPILLQCCHLSTNCGDSLTFPA